MSSKPAIPKKGQKTILSHNKILKKGQKETDLFSPIERGGTVQAQLDRLTGRKAFEKEILKVIS
jgi:hypothetical protein